MSRFQVRAGSALPHFGGTVHHVRNISVHPDYNKKRSEDNDVAVLKLKNKIELDNVTKKAIKMFESTWRIQSEVIVTVAGWGDLAPNVTNRGQLQSLNMKIFDRDNCSNIIETSARTEHNEFAELHDGQICAVSTNNNENKSFCDGDSGGPMVVNNKLAGIVSLAVGCSSKPIPNIFTEVAYFRKWIDETIKKFMKN